MKKLTIAYFGTPYFSAILLDKIVTDKTLPFQVMYVVTQPDKPVGKKQIVTPSPVKEVAEKYKIPISEFKPALDVDLCLVYAYGVILPKELLTVPKYGFFCIHPSLLPKYRGASPIAYPLMSGDTKTGVTIFQMDEKIDHGPIVVQKEMNIAPDDRRPQLEKKLTSLAFDLLKTIDFKKLHPLEQDHSKATYTHFLKKDDGYIPFGHFTRSDLVKSIYNRFRGLYPWPGIWTLITIKDQEKRLKITDLEYTNSRLIIKKVQLEGKNEVDFKIFNKAYRVF